MTEPKTYVQYYGKLWEVIGLYDPATDEIDHLKIYENSHFIEEILTEPAIRKIKHLALIMMREDIEYQKEVEKQKQSEVKSEIESEIESEMEAVNA